MTSIKIKMKACAIENEQRIIVYQVVHNRSVRLQKTNYLIYPHEWNEKTNQIRLNNSDENRNLYLKQINSNISSDLEFFNLIIQSLNRSTPIPYTATDIVHEFIHNRHRYFLFTFMEKIIEHLSSLGQIRTSETYTSTLRSFRRFRNNIDIPLLSINSNIIREYESYLRKNGVCPNTSSFYMRILRAVYNRAVDSNLIEQQYPFKLVYTGIDKTVKRALSLKAIKKIKEMDLTDNPSVDLARDMFLFSFYTRGMAFVDMAYLRKKDLCDGVLSYRRHKTGQQLFIKWEECMQEIVDKYSSSNHSTYLLPIISPTSRIDERKQYIYASHNINLALKIIGQKLGIHLTLYVARHSWASIAKSKRIPISIISEAMGHDSESTTYIYLASLDTSAIDKANRLIIRSL